MLVDLFPLCLEFISPQMKFFQEILLSLYRIYAILLFIILMIFFLPFMFIAALFGIYVGGNIIFFLIRLWARLWYFFCGLRHEVKGKNSEAGNFIYLCCKS